MKKLFLIMLICFMKNGVLYAAGEDKILCFLQKLITNEPFTAEDAINIFPPAVNDITIVSQELYSVFHKDEFPKEISIFGEFCRFNREKIVGDINLPPYQINIYQLANGLSLNQQKDDSKKIHIDASSYLSHKEYFVSISTGKEKDVKNFYFFCGLYSGDYYVDVFYSYIGNKSFGELTGFNSNAMNNAMNNEIKNEFKAFVIKEKKNKVYEKFYLEK